MLDSVLINEKTNSESTSKKDLKKYSDYITYIIQPLKYKKYEVEQWIVMLEQLKNIQKDFYFSIRGNKEDYKLYVSIPFSEKYFFETVFWSSFDFAQLNIQNNNYNFKTKNNIGFSHDVEIKTRFDFSKKNITDPFKDILNIFQWIDQDSTLEIVFQVRYNLNKNKIWSWKNWFRKNAGSDIFYMSVWYNLNSKNNSLHYSIKNTIVWVFQRFCKTWKVSISNYQNTLSLEPNQLSSFFHLPTWEVALRWLDLCWFKALPPVVCEDFDSYLNIGYSIYRNEKQQICISNDQVNKHLYILWKTWTWKSTLIANLVLQDIKSNTWLCLVDPHWDLVDEILKYIPKSRIDDVILFDVSDTKYPLWFNLLERNNEEEKHLIVSGLISVFYKLFSYSRWPRMEYILRNVLYTVIEYPNSTLLHIIKVLTDKKFRKEVLKYVKDEVILNFWNNEFDKWSERQLQEVISPLTNKIWQFLSSSNIRNIVGQAKSWFNLFEAMQSNKIILINLSKWKIWEDMSSLIWMMFITKIQIETMKRASLSAEKREKFHLYIDEFQNFSTDSFSTILSEARKYNLWLVIANQYISQLTEKVRLAVFWNVASMIVFWLWHKDADMMSKEFWWIISTKDFQILPNYQAYVKLALKTWISDPFHVFTQNIQDIPTNNVEEIIQKSRQKYCKKLEDLNKIEELENSTSFDDSKSKKELSESELNKIEIWVEQQNVDKIEIWKPYVWIVKLKYNYWMFVKVWEYEWLLHKNDILQTNWVKRKKLYKEWDQITVIAKDFKEINWQKKVVWTQKV